MPPQKLKNNLPHDSPKGSQHNEVNTASYEHESFELAKDSLLATQGIVKRLNQNIDERIQSIEAVKKLPDYNTEYCLEIAANVNDVSIKTYDIRADDGSFAEPKIKKRTRRAFPNYSMVHAIEEEDPFPDPKCPAGDRHMKEKVVVKYRFRPNIPNFSNRDWDARSSGSKKSYLKLGRRPSKNNELRLQAPSIMQSMRDQTRSPGLKRKKSNLRVQIFRDDGSAQTPSGMSPELKSFPDKPMPLTAATPNRVIRKASLNKFSSRTVGQDQEEVKLSMNFVKKIEYEDGGDFDEAKIDQMRIHVVAHKARAAKEKSIKKQQAQRHNSVKMVSPDRPSRHPSVSLTASDLMQTQTGHIDDTNRDKSLSEMKNIFNKDQRSHVYENGTFVHANKFNIEKLPQLRDQNKNKVRVHQKETQVNKPGEFIMVPAPGQTIKQGEQPQMIRRKVFDAKEQVQTLKRMHEIKKNIKMIMMNREKLEEFKTKSRIADSAANANHKPLLRQRPSVSMSIGVMTDVMSETDEFLNPDEPPPLDMKKMETFNSKEPITNYIKPKYLKNQDSSQNQVPNRQCLKINYGVVYKEPSDTPGQQGEFKLEGGAFLEDPDNANKLTRDQFLQRQKNLRRPYFSHVPSEAQSMKKIEGTSASVPDLHALEDQKNQSRMGTSRPGSRIPLFSGKLQSSTFDKRNRREIAASIGVKRLQEKLETSAINSQGARGQTMETHPDSKKDEPEELNEDLAITENLNVNRSIASAGNKARSSNCKTSVYSPGMGRLVQQILLKKQHVRKQSKEFSIAEVEMRQNAKTGLVHRDRMAVMKQGAAREMSTLCPTEGVGDYGIFHPNVSSSGISIPIQRRGSQEMTGVLSPNMMTKASLNHTSSMPISQPVTSYKKVRLNNNWLTTSRADSVRSDRVVKKNLESISSNMMSRRLVAKNGYNPFNQFGSPSSKNIAKEMIKHHRRDSNRYDTQKQIRKKVL